MATKTGVVVDPGCLGHDMGRHYPETPKRLQVLLDLLLSSDIAGLGLRSVAGRRATQEEVLRVHTEPYFRRVMATQGRTVVLDMDTTACPRTFDSAMLAAGCTVAATSAVFVGEVRNAMALVRPPGHHAEPDRGKGFCFFNNVAIAARHARQVLGIPRVAIVDFDLHHADGTQRIFWQDPSVLVVSVHQFPLYPGTGAASEVGEGAGRGANINIPLAAGHGDPEYDAVFGGLVSRILDQFKPGLILVSAGFDAFVGDPIGRMELTAEGFARIAAHLRSSAERCCDGRLVMTLEGGYALNGLRDGVMACLVAMSRTTTIPPLAGAIEDLPIGDAARHLQIYREFFTL